SNGILGAGYTKLANSIVANNRSKVTNQDLAGTFAEVYSLIRNVGAASVVTFQCKNGQDPLLGPLAVNGGPTLTMRRALPSPAFASAESLGGVDQLGLRGQVNGRSDMGAVERQSPEDIIFRNGADP